MNRTLSIASLLLFFSLFVKGNDTIKVDFANKTKTNINNGIASANLCWLLDSDKKRPNKHQSMKSALQELGCGSLRFPYGHLADNYLWHTPPYSDTKKGLRPKIATLSRPPGTWKWAVNANGSFKDAMDFDEYMALCESLDIRSLVVVNVFSHKYEGGPSLEMLIESAVEWVKYAKKKGYEVDYWQIGNEVDHHPGLLTKEEYVVCYRKIAGAMKNANPQIKVGPGILGKPAYFQQIVQNYPDLIDFTSCHQYMFPFKISCKTYELWKEYNGDFIPNVEKIQNAVSASEKSNMEIVVTETGVSPSRKGMGSVNNTYKAIWWFDVLMDQVSQKNVAYSYFWGTHSPWQGAKDNDNDDVAVLLRLDNNSRKPIANIMKLVNENMTDNLVETTRRAGYVSAFSGINNNDKMCKVFLMNKDNTPQKIVLSIDNLPKNVKSFSRIEFKGKDPEDRNPKLYKSEGFEVLGNKMPIVLPPLSVTILTGLD